MSGLVDIAAHQLGRQAAGLRRQRPPPRLRGSRPWIAVSGGKGGVGKTVVAVNLALWATQQGYRTLLVDLDPGLGDVDVHLRLHADRDLEDAASGRCPPAAAVVDGPGKLRVLLGRSGSTRLATGDASFLASALDAVAAAGQDHDLLICDCGAGIGPAVIEVARRASLTLAVTTPDPAAVTDAYALCKVLRRCGSPLPSLVVNRASGSDAALRTAAKLRSVCQRFLGQPLPYLGRIRIHAAIERSVIDQRPLLLGRPGPAADDLAALGAAVLSELPVPPSPPR